MRTAASILCLGLALAAGNAQAAPGAARAQRAARAAAPAAKAAALSIEAAAAVQIQAAVPPGLALVSLTIPGGAAPAPADLAAVWVSPPRAGAVSVQLTGGGQKRWARVVLAEVGPVVIAHRALAAGDVVAAGDLVRAERPLTDPHALTLDPAYLDGAELVHPVAEGAVIVAADLRLPPPIARGTAVTVVVQAGAARVSTRGALERPARVGERVAVRLDGAARVVEGELVSPDTVRLGGPR